MLKSHGSNKKRLYIVLDHRGAKSLGENRTFHWSLLLEPKTQSGVDSLLLDATDAFDSSSPTDSIANTDRPWRFRAINIDPAARHTVVCKLLIAKIGNSVDDTVLVKEARAVRLPERNSQLPQDCYTWMWDAVRRMQERGLVAPMDQHHFTQRALAFADECIAKGKFKVVRDMRS